MWLDYLILGAAVAILLLQLIALNRRSPADNATAEVKATGERLERAVRDEFSRNREESSGAARELRAEVSGSVQNLGQGIGARMLELTQFQQNGFEGFTRALVELNGGVQQSLEAIRATVDTTLGSLREELAKQDAAAREEITRAIHGFNDSMQSRIVQLGQTQQERMDAFGGQLAGGMTQLGEALAGRIAEMASFQKQQLEVFAQNLNTLSTGTGNKLEAMRETVERKLGELQHDNAQKLEQMRQTVDEKLHNTLEQRLGESFKLVSQQLEQVHSGLGEMRVLATGVGDLKKVLTNIKTRGCWGEVQLGNLLEQMLTPDQFDRNVAPKEASNERVEYAIRLPGKDTDGAAVWLPIDAKFPQEEYQRLVDAHERGDAEAAEAASSALQTSVRAEAKKINEKYVNPPRTTDFAIMFLPTEGLFAEVLRRPGLCETLQREFRVVLCGPTNLAALLSSLQMGFRTLAIERRSSEVWTVLGAIKTEFGKFGTAIERVKKKLQEATNTVDEAQTRTRVMQRRLQAAQELPAADAANVLGADSFSLLGTDAGDEEDGKSDA